MMNNQLGLRDIDGIDAISWWPLAPGWWIVIAVVASMALAIALLIYVKKRRSRWQFQMRHALDTMNKGITADNAQTEATKLAELIRRLAIHRFSRSECAHLKGGDWIDWLSKHDPGKYDWTKSSQILTQAPFQPPGFVVDPVLLRQTIVAIKGWVK